MFLFFFFKPSSATWSCRVGVARSGSGSANECSTRLRNPLTRERMSEADCEKMQAKSKYGNS